MIWMYYAAELTEVCGSSENEPSVVEEFIKEDRREGTERFHLMEQNKMLHPSYTDLMKVVNSEVGNPVKHLRSQLAVIMVTAKRARQIIAEVTEPLVTAKVDKPCLSRRRRLNPGVEIKILMIDRRELTRRM